MSRQEVKIWKPYVREAPGSFTYISGVAKCLAEAPFVAEARNQIFNIGADERMSVKDLAGHICRILGVREDLVLLPARQEVIHAHADHSRVRNAFPKVLAECPTDSGRRPRRNGRLR